MKLIFFISARKVLSMPNITIFFPFFPMWLWVDVSVFGLGFSNFGFDNWVIEN